MRDRGRASRADGRERVLGTVRPVGIVAQPRHADDLVASKRHERRFGPVQPSDSHCSGVISTLRRRRMSSKACSASRGRAARAAPELGEGGDLDADGNRRPRLAGVDDRAPARPGGRSRRSRSGARTRASPRRRPASAHLVVAARFGVEREPLESAVPTPCRRCAGSTRGVTATPPMSLFDALPEPASSPPRYASSRKLSPERSSATDAVRSFGRSVLRTLRQSSSSSSVSATRSSIIPTASASRVASRTARRP